MSKLQYNMHSVFVFNLTIMCVHTYCSVLHDHPGYMYCDVVRGHTHFTDLQPLHLIHKNSGRLLYRLHE